MKKVRKRLQFGPSPLGRESSGFVRPLARKVDYDDVPIKAQRVFKELNEFSDEETIFVTCIGLNQIWSGQLQKISKPRHYLDCGGAGPLGWDLPAAIGAKCAADKQIVQVVGDFGFQFCMEEFPVAVMYGAPFVIVVLNNGYLGLIRQAEKYVYDMNFEFRSGTTLSTMEGI